MMLSTRTPRFRRLRDIGLRAAALLLSAGFLAEVRAQTPVTRDDIVAKLDRLDAAPDLDIAALRQQVLDRSKTRSKTEPPPQKRLPIAPDLANLAAYNVDIQFDTDTPIVLPESYETVGRIADALMQSNLLPYGFLIVGHIDATGRREANALLSQRRADAIRDILVNTFKISAKRIQSVGLGEEQLLDPARPNAPVNRQLQIMTVSKLPEQSEQPTPPATKGAPAPAKKPTRKR